MSREKLRMLEETGEHVFHGSPDGNIESLEPRQGHHVPDWSDPETKIKDGDPAVSATPYAELATFRAIVNDKNLPFNHTTGFGIRDGKPDFRVSSQEVIDGIKDKKGFVYVFDKKEFVPYRRDREATPDAMEWRSYKTVKPVDVVEVGHEDLHPIENIRIVEQ